MTRPLRGVAADAGSQSPVTAPRLLDDDALATGDLDSGLEALKTHLPLYHRAAQYYAGDIPELFASIRLRRAMARTGMGFRFNFAKTPVDAITDRLEVSAVKSSDEAVTAVLGDLWEDNQLDLEAPNIHRRAGEFGDAYVIVWPTPEPDELGPEDTEASPNVGIYYNAPDVCRLFYDPENPLLKSHAIKRWQLPATKQWRVDLFYADRIERYVSQVGKKGEKAADFVLYTDDPADEWPMVNPFGAIPVFHFRTDRPYGSPEHSGFYGPQDAINKLIISHMAGVDYQSFPQRYALTGADGDTSEAAALDEDQFAFAMDTGSTATAGRDPQSQFTADPGSLWFMKGVTQVGQFTVADPDVFLKPIEMYLKSGAQITTTPLHYFDPAGDTPSGESLRTAEAPFIKKVRNRQLSYGGTWRDVFLFALHVMGVEDADVQVVWAPAHTVDDETGWTTNHAKLEAGVPHHQVLMEAGYSDEQIETWFSEQEESLDERVQTLLVMAQAAAAFAPAVTAGVLTQAQVQAIMQAIIGDPGDEAA